ncbi:MAG: hypothetical protein QOF73_1338 [Thermomicrobiales bacterium]|nr:hypothetical protein [Thermomicrobiales bacterium]
MVECFDRIHLQLAELVLRPLRELHQQPHLTAVTVRPPGRGPRVRVTVSKTWPDGPECPPSYFWTASEIATAGDDLPGGPVWTDDASHDSPEAAYWAAVDEIATSRCRPALRQ